MKIGRAEFVEDVHIPGLKVRRPVQLTAGEYERLAEPGLPPPTSKAKVELSVGEHKEQGVDPTWLVVTVDGEVKVLVPEPRIGALYPPEKPTAAAHPEQGGARQHPSQQGPKR